MGILNIVGFEAGNIGNGADSESIFTGTGTGELSTTVFRSGLRAAHVTCTTTQVGVFRIRAHEDGHIRDSFSVATVYASVYFRSAALPSSDNEEFFAFDSKLRGRITSTGKIQLYDATTSQLGSDGATTLSTNTWYRIEVKCGTGSVAGSYELKIDGVSELSGTGNLSDTNNANLYLGKLTNRNGQGVEYYFDDVMVRDDQYPGQGSVGILLPDSNGTYTDFVILAGSGELWQQVDEVPNDNFTTLLGSAGTLGDAFTAGLESPDSKSISGAIQGVKAYVVARAEAGAPIKVRIRGGGTDSDGVQTSGVTYQSRGYILATNPGTGSAWTTSGLDSAEVGAVDDSGDVEARISTVYLMVDYNENAIPEAQPGPLAQVI